ncbi:510_t:CDS:2 [Racocetra fulgida]|uniref:510_t:CDS:1 n=1 Tax=Racocetra fulgida TaxID=60492 RepID=A0A9N8Z6U7_9GLOM|nr:510_t:CDS:2 [Racocetra fulgida]
MPMEKYVIRLDKSNEKETQESDVFVSSLAIKQPDSTKKPKLEWLTKSNLHFNPSLTQHIKIREHINAAKDKDIGQQNLFSTLNIFPDLCNLINFTHLNYNEITYRNPSCTINPPYLHLEENNEFDSTNEDNYATYQNPVTGPEAILKDLELFCIAKGLDLTRLIHFGSDGASNMTGAKLKLH